MWRVTSILECKISKLPVKYLGLPLGVPFKSYLFRKLYQRKWRGNWLVGKSKGGRVTVIKSTISNLPAYFHYFQSPTKVALPIDKLQWDSLQRGINDEFKFHWVKWSKICSPIQGGRLGMQNLQIFNKALLGKWQWRYCNERGPVQNHY